MQKFWLPFAVMSVCFSANTFAQFTKNALSLDGTVDITSKSYKSTNAFLSNSDKRFHDKSILLNPQLSKRVSNHWEIGGYAYLSKGIITAKNDDYAFHSDDIELELSTRYYFNPEKNYKFYATAGALWYQGGYNYSAIKYRWQGTDVFMGLGALKSLNSQIALDATLTANWYQSTGFGAYQGTDMRFNMGLRNFIVFNSKENQTQTPPQYVREKRHVLTNTNLALTIDSRTHAKINVNYDNFINKYFSLGAGVQYDRLIGYRQADYTLKARARVYAPITRRLSLFGEGNYQYTHEFANNYKFYPVYGAAMGANYFITPHVALDVQLLNYSTYETRKTEVKPFTLGPKLSLMSFL